MQKTGFSEMKSAGNLHWVLVIIQEGKEPFLRWTLLEERKDYSIETVCRLTLSLSGQFVLSRAKRPRSIRRRSVRGILKFMMPDRWPNPRLIHEALLATKQKGMTEEERSRQVHNCWQKMVESNCFLPE